MAVLLPPKLNALLELFAPLGPPSTRLAATAFTPLTLEQKIAKYALPDNTASPKISLLEMNQVCTSHALLDTFARMEQVCFESLLWKLLVLWYRFKKAFQR